MKEKTRVKKMYILDGGSFLYDRGMMQLGMDLDKRQRIICPFLPLTPKRDGCSMIRVFLRI